MGPGLRCSLVARCPRRRDEGRDNEHDEGYRRQEVPARLWSGHPSLLRWPIGEGQTIAQDCDRRRSATAEIYHTSSGLRCTTGASERRGGRAWGRRIRVARPCGNDLRVGDQALLTPIAARCRGCPRMPLAPEVDRDRGADASRHDRPDRGRRQLTRLAVRLSTSGPCTPPSGAVPNEELVEAGELRRRCCGLTRRVMRSGYPVRGPRSTIRRHQTLPHREGGDGRAARVERDSVRQRSPTGCERRA